MSNVSIFDKNWTDLVFEDKNKAYGAYQLRQENPRTTLFAFVLGVVFVFSLIGSWLLFSSFGKTPTEVPTECPFGETITPVELTTLPEEPVKPETVKQPETPEVNLPEPVNTSNLVVAATNQSQDVPANTEMNNQPDNNHGNDTGTGEPSTDGGHPGPAIVVAPTAPEGTVETRELDRMPLYPGGMDKFYEYVGRHFEKPDMDSRISSVSVIMSFVIEKDGSMTEIKVLRSSDKDVEREAIRVLKSMKVKWSPGYKDNEKMRTLYKLPIRVNLQE